jgi:hypothetical protein
MLDATQPRGLCYYWKSEYLPPLTGAVSGIVRTHAATVTSPMSQIVLFHLGGAIAERDAGDGAVGNRDAEHVLGVQAIWQPGDPESERHIAWTRAAWGELKPHATGGVYVNFLTEEEGEDRVRAAYRGSFDRLARVKASYDPDNLFRVNKNIAPATR